MFQTLLQHLDVLSKSFLDTLKRFPIVSFFAFLLTLIFVVFSSATSPIIEMYPNFNIANKVAFTASLAIPLFLVLRLISNNRILTLLGMIFLVIYYLFLPDSFQTEPQIIQKHLFLILALVLLVFPAPFLFHSIKNAKFWEWTQQVLFAFVSAFLFGIILYMGIQGAIYAFEELFYFKVDFSISEQLSFIIFGIFSLNYFLAQIPKYPILIPIRSYTKVEYILTKYIFTPLSIAYFLILYIYTFKLIYLFELPSSILAWLILMFSSVAIISFLFWTPLWNKKTEKYKKWIWIAILIQTLILGLSIYLRIEQYGVTQNRYFIAILGLWLFFISLYFIVYKNARYKWMFISLSMLIILTQFGSFSAYNIAQVSQTKHLKNLLAQYSKLSEDSNSSLEYQISDTIDYLYNTHGIDSLSPILPEAVTTFKLQDTNNNDCTASRFTYFSRYATNHLGFKYINKWEWEVQQLNKENKPRGIRISSDNQDIGIPIEGYTWFQYFDYTSQNFCPKKSEKSVKIIYTINSKERKISIQKDAKNLLTINLDTFISRLQKIIKEKASNSTNINYRRFKLTQKELTYQYNNKNVAIKLIFKNLYFTKEKKLTNYRGILLIHEK